MKIPWNKGLTKRTNSSLLKTSTTMKSRKLDNFSIWRNEMKNKGLIRSKYPPLKKSSDLAELIGVILGDGHIYKFARVDELSIFSNSRNTGFVIRYSDLVEKVFDKKPTKTRHSGKNCTRIRIYQKSISSRLGIPYSPRRNLQIIVPTWIFSNKMYIVRYLRGLYEAEGCHCVHLPTGTHKLFFTNRNKSMLENVYQLVKKLGFHPHKSKYQVQVSKKKEVESLIDLLQFRKY